MNYVTSIEKIQEVLSNQQNRILLKKVKNLVLIGEMYLNSIKLLKNENIKTYYADPRKMDFKSSDNKITLFGEDGKVIDLTKSSAVDTVILMRSGYSMPVVKAFLNEVQSFGILILNNSEPVEISSDKYLTAKMLESNGLPQPKFSLITSDDVSKEDTSKLDKKLLNIYKKADDNNKFVCKILNGHGGKGVFKCRGKNITSILQAIFKISPKTNILVQDLQDIKDGDIRVHVITINGKQEIINACLRHKGKNDFRTNLSLGNSMEDDYKLTKEQETLALKAASISGLTWCGVDILPLTNGNNMIVELNGAPGPSSSIDDPDIEETNHKFFAKTIECIDKLCK